MFNTDINPWLFSNHLTLVIGAASQQSLKRNIFTADVAIQTESVAMGLTAQPLLPDDKIEVLDEDDPQLSASDLSAILKWSKEISSDINLSSGTFRQVYIVQHE